MKKIKSSVDPAKVRNIIVRDFKDARVTGEYTDDELRAICANSDEFLAELHHFVHRFARRKLTPIFDLAGAIALLGQTSVVSAAQHVETFGRTVSKEEPVLCPSIEQIQECAALNRAGTHKWILAFASALSFQEQHNILGTDNNHKPNYYPDGWFLTRECQEVGSTKPEAGFYLLDMTPRWNKTNWKTQEENITGLGEDYVRADDRVFAQAILALQKATGQQLFDNVYHSGRVLNPSGYCVVVRLDSEGMEVSLQHISAADKRELYVCVARKSRLRALVA